MMMMMMNMENKKQGKASSLFSHIGSLISTIHNVF